MSTWRSRLLVFAILVAGVALAAWPLTTRTHFVLDDYRYLNAIRKADAGDAGALVEATIVENRWDDQWWIPDGTFVRFWRPFVIATYWLDAKVWGNRAAGFVVTNVALHLACCWLVYLLLERLLRRWRPDIHAWPAAAGALLFAVQSCHTEQIWYIAGRTDTLAAVAFLGGLVAWVAGVRAWAVGLLFFVMLVAKEYTLLFVGVVLFIERWLPAEPWSGWGVLVRRRRASWLALGLAFVAFMSARAWALGDVGSGVKPYPYFFLPDRDGFVVRTAAITLDYATSLVTGRPIATFTEGLDEVVARHSWWRLGPAAAALVAFLVASLRTAPGRVGVAAFVLLIVPLLPLYSTGRYLYLPTVGLVLAFAGIVATLRPRGLAFGAALLAIGSQAWQAQRSLTFLPERPQTPTVAEDIATLFSSDDLTLEPDAAPIFVADMPVGWLGLQFARDVLEVLLEHDVPPIAFLSSAPPNAGPGLALLERRGAGFALARPNGPVYLEEVRSDFEQRRVVEGELIEETGYQVEILRERDGLATALEVTPVGTFQLVSFRPTPDGRSWHTVGVPRSSDDTEPR